MGINRSTLYYEQKETSLDDINILNEIREIWERHPFYGYRKITAELRNSGLKINRKRVQRLMQTGNIVAIYPGPNTNKRNKLHAIHPYLLGNLEINRVDQVWMVDITYLRMEHGFMYLVAIIDVYSRYVVGWKLSNSLETSYCIEALKFGMVNGRKPEITNSDQGCQFTSEDWVVFLNAESIKISMTGKGRCIDNVYIERFWRSYKREEFYLNEYATVKELKKAIEKYIEFYNERRWHQALNYRRPAEIYNSGIR